MPDPKQDEHKPEDPGKPEPDVEPLGGGDGDPPPPPKPSKP
jgi:hypothetical protein